MEVLDDSYQGDKFSRTIEDLIENGYETDVYRYIREGWEIFKKNAGLFIAFTLVWALFNGVTYDTQITPWFTIKYGGLLNVLIGPCLTAGWYIAARRTSHGQELRFEHFFDGFKLWAKVIPFHLVAMIFMAIGMVFLVLPGIYLAVSYVFVIPIIVLYKEDLPLMDTLEGSRKVISKKWWNFFGFGFLLLGVNILGVLALGIGVLVSVPVSACAMYAAYEDIFGANLEDV